MCPREKLTRPKTIMSFDHFANLVDESKLRGAKIISIFGFGEPLLDPGISKKVAYCSGKGLETFITTNGSLLTYKMARMLRWANLTKIRISLHGTGENYDSVHRGLNFQKFTRNLTSFIDVNKDRQIQSELTMMPLNGEPVNAIRRRWEGALDHLEIWHPHNWGSTKKYRKLKRKLKTCGRPFSGPVQINADGKMMVCCFDFNAEMTVGDTYKDSIESILKGKKFKAIRDKHRTGVLKGLPCENCDQLNEYEESPLLFSTKDKTRGINRTSTNKFELKEI
jgi:sulfatase maturation enzyme AslB (radical SAM superfamily)